MNTATAFTIGIIKGMTSITRQENLGHAISVAIGGIFLMRKKKGGHK